MTAGKCMFLVYALVFGGFWALALLNPSQRSVRYRTFNTQPHFATLAKRGCFFISAYFTFCSNLRTRVSKSLNSSRVT